MKNQEIKKIKVQTNEKLSRLTSVAEETTRIRAYCRKLNLPEHINFISESSEIVLPCGDNIPQELDMVFIDGAHRFPLPIIDWHYTSLRLKAGVWWRWMIIPCRPWASFLIS